MSEKIVKLQNIAKIPELLGSCDENLQAIQREYNVILFCRDADIHITGEPEQTEKAANAIRLLMELAEKGQHLTEQTVRYVTSMVSAGEAEALHNFNGDGICITTSGKVVRPKTVGQRKYVDAIQKNTIVLGVGPAGTGKTYLAVALAVRAFRAHEVQKIILTRPAVEAGEKLGFLPGDLQEKVDPY
ncbi:MAG: PhoH family protein, partial [Oscillospiraceae bacterium]|nr:PhoH family protein [Oscillospiraceae bacterium]